MMFNSWRVITFTRNMSDGEAEFMVRKNSEKEAIDTFYNNCNTYGTNPATKTCQVVVYDPEGHVIKDEQIDNSKYIPAEEPVAEEE